ncbi:hypothetical protein OpiT1DRAFT_03837 [Opitutaceae bacterium TAV1]|nr:hypothetical protein OpiT1DRAFT_03837 [Opitutaceae bacterium TAV1]
MKLFTATILLLSLSLSGCVSVIERDNGARLRARDDWTAARDAAPAWCLDALNTIADLEYELERQ